MLATGINAKRLGCMLVRSGLQQTWQNGDFFGGKQYKKQSSELSVVS